VRNVTESRRIGPAFRIDGNPAVIRGRDGVIVFACGSGALVRYRCDRLGRWKADPVNAERLGRLKFTGTPALIEQEGLHVLCRTETGELIHLHEQRKLGWTGTSVPTSAGGQARAIVVDDPIFLRDPTGKGLNAITRSKEGGVLLLHWSAQKGWSATDLSASSRPEKGLPPAMSPLSAAFDEEGTLHVAARDAQGGLVHVWCTATGSRGGEQVTRLRAIGARGRIDGAPRLAVGPAGALHVVAHQDKALLLFRWTPVGGWSVESVSRERRSLPAAGLAGEPVVACADETMHIAFADDTGRLYHACGATRRPQRPTAKREPRSRRLSLPDRPAPAATNGAAHEVVRSNPVEAVAPAPPEPGRTAETPVAPEAHSPPEARVMPEAHVTPEAHRAPRARVSPEARVTPETRAPSEPRSAAQPRVTSEPRRTPERRFIPEPVTARAATPEPLHVPVSAKHLPDAPVVRMPPRPVGDARRTEPAQPPMHRSPALEGLPLLPDDDSAPRRKPAAVSASKTSPARTAPTRSRKNEQEMERIMALADQNPLKLIDPT
jgi:hypothetical protein